MTNYSKKEQGFIRNQVLSCTAATSSHVVNFSLTRWMWSGWEFSLCGSEMIEGLWGLGAALGVVTFSQKVEKWAALQDVRLAWTCDPW